MSRESRSCANVESSGSCSRKAEADKKEKKVGVDDSRCACCLKPFIIGRGVECNDCNSRFCRKGCGRWEVKDNVWLCLFCYHKRTWLEKKEKWFETFGGVHSLEESENNSSTVKSQVYVKATEHATINPGLDLAAGGSQEVDSMENIREIIEKVVEGLVGNVDDAPVDRLYQHPSYKPAAADTPSMAHTALRELVERAVDEARKLPGLGDSVTIKRKNNANISEQSYEDLLAAAILNRVVEKYQKSRVDDNSNVVHETTTRRCKRSEMSGEEASSADDAMSQDDCSSECSGKIKSRLVRVQQEPLSLTIEEQIEEVTTTYTSDEEPRNVKENILNFRCSRRVPFPEFGMDIVDPSQESSEDSEDDIDGSTAPIEHITPLETWEENWLFQKKRIATQSEPVAMLVPNPSEDYRALIGDKDADDMSDLSEFSAGQSDAEEIDEDLIEAINRIDSPKLVRVPINNNTVILNDNFTCEISHENSNTIPNDGVNYNENVEKQKIEKNDTVENNEVKNDEAEKNLIAPSLDDVKRENNNQLPKTPTVTPTRNSISESEPMPVCDLEKLNEKLSAIDDNIEEEMVIETKEVNHEFDKSLEFIHKSTEKMDTSYAKCTAKLSGDEQECSLVSSTPKVKLARSTEAKLNDEGPQLSTPPRPGTIAEREHKKWENAPPIQNNPYSQENIQKRLLERQYSRRSSDVSGVLPTSPSPPLQIVLGVNRPDVQRFARDYYINEAKSPTGERRLGQGTSSSSRPSSSLSLNSTSTSSDYEHQVSQGLERFEEASLRGSLHRSTYSGPNASPHFVINPLIHLDLCDEPLNNNNSNDSLNESNEIMTDFTNVKFPTVDMKSHEIRSNENDSIITCTINPLYDEKNHLQPMEMSVDRDSGMFSIDSNDSRSDLLNQSLEEATRLSWTEADTKIQSSNYWSHKFQTFGGIKRQKLENNTDDIFDDSDDYFYDKPEPEVDMNFSEFKFQTFGGIKQRNKFDKYGISIYRRPKVRSSMSYLIEPVNSRHSSDNSREKLRIKGDNLRLEAPLVPNVVERNYTSLVDLKKKSSVRRRPSKNYRSSTNYIYDSHEE